MHFVMYAFSNHVGALHNVTPIDLPAQSAVLSDGVVVSYLYKHSARPFPSCGGEWSSITGSIGGSMHFVMYALPNVLRFCTTSR